MNDNTQDNKDFEHLIAVLLKGKKNPILRSNDFFQDIYTKTGVDPISVEMAAIRSYYLPFITAVSAKIEKRDTDEGIVSSDVTEFLDKEKELPALMDKWSAMAYIALDGNANDLKFLYFTDRSTLSKGNESVRKLRYEGWLTRLETKLPAIVDVKALITPWVTNLCGLLGSKAGEKELVRGDRTNVGDVLDAAYTATLVVVGKMLVAFNGDVSKVIRYFDTNILKPNKFNPMRLYKNDTLVSDFSELLMNVQGVKNNNSGYVVIDNKTDRSIKLFRSVSLLTACPDYAIEVAANTKVVIKVSDLGPDTALYFMVKFAQLPVTGYLKITTRRRK